MSEYQRIAFRAIDGPVSDNNLEFMRKQSSRAEITSWSFDNEYHYGDFHGDRFEMLRRGYDLQIHYANFGTRNLLIRLPNGLPDPEADEPYLDDEGVQFHPDKRGPGGILALEPCYEAGEELWDLDEIIGRLIPLRSEILDGDLRPLYLMHLAMACDSNHDPEAREAPVPAGLDNLSNAQRALAEYCGLDSHLVAAAAEDSPPLTPQVDPRGQYADWLATQPEAAKNAWLAQWMSDPDTTARREILAKFREECRAPSWPIVRPDRTIATLIGKAEEIRVAFSRKAVKKTNRKRTK
jgi:hypothetical protein